MRTLGNILWFVLLGWWQGLIYGLCGVIFCITIVGIPIGKALFQYAYLMMLPFGKQIVRETFIKGKENVSAVRRVGGIIANVIWFPIGFLTMLFSIGEMLACFLSIIFIPVGIVLAKSCTFLLFPIGAKVITKEEYQAIYYANEMKRQNMYNSPQNFGNQNNNNYIGNNQQYGYGNNQQQYGYGNNQNYQNSPYPNNQSVASAPVFCSRCGTKIYDGNSYCISCGNKVR